MAKVPLFDPLGLPISPEVLWDSVEGVVRGVQKVASVAVETVKQDVAGRGLDMSSSHTDFQRGRSKTPDVAKSPELLKLEEAGRKKDFFNITEADLNKVIGQNATKELRVEKLVSINTKLDYSNVLFEGTVNEAGTPRIDVQANLDRVNSEKKPEEVKAKRDQMVAQARGSFQMRENEMFQGTERSGGGHFTTTVG